MGIGSRHGSRYTILNLSVQALGAWSSAVLLLDLVEELLSLALNLGTKVGRLEHLADLDHFIVGARDALCPLDRFFLRFHLDHPVAADHLLCFREGTIGDLGLAP